jgi:energy-converting hydrogenase B subunit D
MTALQVAALVLVAVGGLAVVLVGDPLRQALVLGIYGFALTFLFFTFQAPDVALSEITVAGIGMPVIILAALRKISGQAKAKAQAEDAGHQRGEAAGGGAER